MISLLLLATKYFHQKATGDSKNILQSLPKTLISIAGV